MTTTIHSLITVHPNKWLLLDPDGKPIAMVPADPCEGGRGKLGARQNVETGEWRYTADSLKVRATNYIRDRVRKGELFVEDPIVARDLGVRDWIEPKKALEIAKTQAVAAYDAQHGAGAWAAANEPKTAPARTGRSKE